MRVLVAIRHLEHERAGVEQVAQQFFRPVAEFALESSTLRAEFRRVDIGDSALSADCHSPRRSPPGKGAQFAGGSRRISIRAIPYGLFTIRI